MRKLQQKQNIPLAQSITSVVVAFVTLLLCFTPPVAQANITNVIWQATLAGQLAIQQYNGKLQPREQIASFKNSDFLTMVVGGASTTNVVLGVNFVMSGGQTNFYLSVYVKTNRQNFLRITTNETMALISDGKNLTFTIEAPMLTTNSTWGGGFLRIAGTGKIVSGVPGQLNAAVNGVFIDNRPSDLNGTTGLVIKATLSTLSTPLRVQPSN